MVASASGNARQRRFQRLGLHGPDDFVVHLPLRYEDETHIHGLADVRPGQSVQLEGEPTHVQVQYRPRRQLTARLESDGHAIGLRWLHFYPSQISRLQSGLRLRFLGEVRQAWGGGLELVHPRIQSADTPLPQSLTPIYPTTDGLSQTVLRKAVNEALAQADLSDTLPIEIQQHWQLMPFARAIRTLHHPPPTLSARELAEKGHPAWSRIKFDELLAQQLALARARQARRRQRARPLQPKADDLSQKLLAALPFQLTDAQQRVIAEISSDLVQDYPMLRLLQGDVGSGKTIVAAFAAIQAIAAGTQVALMAPTEILAGQHYDKLKTWLEPLGVQMCWLTGSLGARERRESLQRIAAGSVHLAVGTQALIQDHVHFDNLGLIILDEQHRFGVGQRLALSRKGEQSEHATTQIPHQLTMSATPIPRTLAMTFLADLDVSVIDELPPGRSPVITKLVDDSRRDEVLAHVRNGIQAGQQAYWVCPLVEESDALQLQTAVDTHEQIRTALPELRTGLLHGRMGAAEKQQIMMAFRSGDLDLLVATTVIEVGVDVPNASLMVIEHAERFGLAQLHQLRGRVGRGSAQSICVLLYQRPLSAIARERLRAMYETEDGFEIARRDLQMRGPGEFLGIRQSGQQLLRFADPQDDGLLAEQARQAAADMLEHYPEHADRHIQRWMRGRTELLRS